MLFCPHVCSGMRGFQLRARIVCLLVSTCSHGLHPDSMEEGMVWRRKIVYGMTFVAERCRGAFEPVMDLGMVIARFTC